MKKIFIVTLTFNTAQETNQWLDSFTKLSLPNDTTIEYVIVDNGSTNTYVLEAKYRNRENIRLIRSHENTGFTGGNNIGIQFALDLGATHIMIVNNDTTADKDLLENLLTVLESDEKIGAVVPKIYFAKGREYHKDRYSQKELGKVFWYAGGSIDWANVQGVHRGLDEVDHEQYEKGEKVTFGTGCCMLIKRKVLEKTGVFDNKYFLYFEDLDLSVRMQKAGFQIYYVPQALIWHSNASSSGGAGANLHDYFLTRNRMLFGMRYAPLRAKIALTKESFRLLASGRPMQKRAIQDYYVRNFGKGSYFKNT